ncbi:MAG: hypothetical protein HYZ29_01045 [Myxococcales bacterium]|nr:hypothetical protein [Myxococcales bacterium]
MLVLFAADATDGWLHDDERLPTEVEVHVYLTDYLDFHELGSASVGAILNNPLFAHDPENRDEAGYPRGHYWLTAHGRRMLRVLAERHRLSGQPCKRVTEVTATRRGDGSLHLVLTRGRLRKELVVPPYRTWFDLVANEE